MASDLCATCNHDIREHGGRPEGKNDACQRCACKCMVRIVTIGPGLTRIGEPSDPITPSMMEGSGAWLIAEERNRQITRENWQAAHDDTHRRGEMARAAACYALHGLSVKGKPRWPWSKFWWKPTDPIRNLVKAGALIAAEIDRLRRLVKEHANMEQPND